VFSGKVGSESAENIDNYAICNRLTSGDSISVVSATLLGGGTTVGLVLAEPFIDNTPYVLEADRVADTTGNSWVSWGQFGNGPDLVISELAFQDTLPGCVEDFNVTCTVVNTGEFPAQSMIVALSYQGVDDEGNPVGPKFNDYERLEELAAGDSVTALFEIQDFWLKHFYSLGNVTVIVDFEEYIDEAREDNNILSSMLVMLAPRVDTFSKVGDLVQIEFSRALYDSGDIAEPVTEYEIFRRNDTLGVYETAAVADADYSPAYIVDIPPFPDVEYTRFFIRAVRPAGGTTYHYDSCVLAIRTGENVAPGAPAGFTGRQVGDDMYLEWDQNWEPDIFYYVVWWNETPDFPPDPDPPDPPYGYNVPFPYTHYTHKDWDPGMELYYRICAVNRSTNISEFVFLAPTEVVSTQLQSFSSQVKENMIEVSWSVAASLDVPEFHVFRSVAVKDRFERLPGNIERTGGTDFRYVDSDVESGETYLFRIEVRDDDGSRVLFETDPVSRIRSTRRQRSGSIFRNGAR
jgi:hypothetical protein